MSTRSSIYCEDREPGVHVFRDVGDLVHVTYESQPYRYDAEFAVEKAVAIEMAQAILRYFGAAP